MYLRAYAKINISLDVLDRREDGYHIVKMIMQSVDLYDDIDVEKCDKGIHINCNKPFIPRDERNIAYKAAKLFMEEFNISSGVKINIKKNIPIAAGMAGGSTDAAAVLRAMREIFNIKVSDEELMKIGVKVGADVPYCIMGGTALCEGIGEILTPIKGFKDKILVVIKPNFGVSTKEVYTSLDLSKIKKHVETDKIINAIENDDLDTVCSNMKNILENVTLNKYNVLKSIKKDLVKAGAKGALMSGSGPTVFAFFEDMLKAQRAFEEFRDKYKEVFITRTI